MVTTHNLGFPRIGAKRELKSALESYWKGTQPAEELVAVGRRLRQENWGHQARCNYVPVGDFSFYDHVLDTSFLLGNIPKRVKDLAGTGLDQYFRVARGRSAGDSDCSCVRAGEMTKWFDTNYHYIVPEVTQNTRFDLNAAFLYAQITEAKAMGVQVKPVLIGPVTYLWLSKAKDGSEPLELLDRLLPVYLQLLQELADMGVDWVQIDEPILVTELAREWKQALEKTYHALKSAKVKLLLTTYFGRLKDNLQQACNLPVAGLHIDAVAGRDEVKHVLDWLPVHKVLSLGVINGRNVWKTDLNATLDWLEPVAAKLTGRLWLAPSCSLLHVPLSLEEEQAMDKEIKSWLAFGVEKLEELAVLATALEQGRTAVASALQANADSIASRRSSNRVHNPQVKTALEGITTALGTRQNTYPQRALLQRERFRLPLFPTTTIGSFPQTPEIRQARRAFKSGELSLKAYTATMREQIAYCVQEQEALGLDVLVHGEPERNDMVEYFGEQLDGYVFSQAGWVQSYGSRCVKPPILFGDVCRPNAMTVDWTCYAQSLTEKPVKGMLTGPVTLLNWSFVRDDQPRSQTCLQLALAIREEVLDLEKAGIGIIQIDEAALREGLPLRRADWQAYLDWATESFRICANGVRDETQIHTHMCYSDFNEIIQAIASMDADVITIETSRSDMELLEVFRDFVYPNEIGPGVYDIHSPNIPGEQQVVELMDKAARCVPPERLWVNPDCGLKTRQWREVVPALRHMVSAAAKLREGYNCR